MNTASENAKSEEVDGADQHYHGLDLVDHSDNPQGGLLNTFKGNKTTTTLQTYCTGERTLYVAEPSKPGIFTSTSIRSRLEMDVHGLFTLILCTSLSNMKDGCNGHYVMIQSKEENADSWHFALVGSLHYLNKQQQDVCIAHLFKWKGTLSQSGYPLFLDCNCWNDASKHFDYLQCNSDNVTLQFVNQVRGKEDTVSPLTRNNADGGIQCVMTGPCQVPFNVPIVLQPSLTKLLMGDRLTAKKICHPDLYYAVKPSQGKRRREMKKSINNSNPEEQQLANDWSKQPYHKLKEEHLQRVVVVTSTSIVLNKTTRSIPKTQKNVYFVPQISTVNVGDPNNALCSFVAVTQETYKELASSQQRVDIADFNNSILAASETLHTLLDVDHVRPGLDCSQDFHDYTRVFAGKGAPPVDESFESIQIPNTSLTAHFKFVPETEYQQHVPLSVGMFQASFHGFKIQPNHIEHMQRAINIKAGLFGKRRRAGHHGELSYIGPRTHKSCSQPSPSEGPNESGYWYYRHQICHFFWPFMLHFMMLLASRISLVGYYQYPQLSKLLPMIANDNREKQDYCDIGILTIDFDCSLHVDNDTIANLDESFRRKLGLLSVSTLMSEHNRESANLALEHISEWGVGSPTTCGYQLIDDKSTEDVEIVQYFCCHGLGICYRIRNYWVHLFLAYCFSHCTSTAIFIKNGKVFFGKYPRKSVFGWGKGRPAGCFFTVVDNYDET